MYSTIRKTLLPFVVDIVMDCCIQLQSNTITYFLKMSLLWLGMGCPSRKLLWFLPVPKCILIISVLMGGVFRLFLYWLWCSLGFHHGTLTLSGAYKAGTGFWVSFLIPSVTTMKQTCVFALSLSFSFSHTHMHTPTMYICTLTAAFISVPIHLYAYGF